MTWPENTWPGKTWVKICGTTNVEDAVCAAEAGADAVGFVFFAKSPRSVTPEQVRQIVKELPDSVTKVGVFVNQREDLICSFADQAGINAVQMHGDREDPNVADAIVKRMPGMKVLAAISMRQSNPKQCAAAWHADLLHAFLLDSGSASKHGGTGEVFNWAAALPDVKEIEKMGRVIVAGGLTPGNVSEAIGKLRPWGVDVVSGVEAAPGTKDGAKVRAFVKAVREMNLQAG